LPLISLIAWSRSAIVASFPASRPIAFARSAAPFWFSGNLDVSAA